MTVMAKSQQKHLEVLRQRRKFLADKIQERKARREQVSYEYAELSALAWALPILEASCGKPQERDANHGTDEDEPNGNR